LSPFYNNLNTTEMPHLKVLHLEHNFVRCLKLGNFEKWIRIPGRFEMWWRNDGVENEDVLRRVKEERNILYTIKGKKANWIGHTMGRNCLVRHVIEDKKMTGRRGRRRKQLLNDLRKKILETERRSIR